MALTMEQRLDFEPDPWDPAPGDKVAGEVVQVQRYDSKFTGEEYPVVDLLTDPDNLTGVRIYGSRTVLGNELDRLQPQPGDRLAVKYAGMVENKGVEYHSYRVVLDRVTPAAPRLAVVPPPTVAGSDDVPLPDGPLPDDE
jgi:hypothetical protein